MKITKGKQSITIIGEDFNTKEILECGQVFSFLKDKDENYLVVSNDKVAKIKVNGNTTTILTNYVDYFYNFFDLDTDYEQIKSKICTYYKDFNKFFGGGANIRILRQDAYQTIISFIVSANNNIKRIKKILFSISKKYGRAISREEYNFEPNVDRGAQDEVVESDDKLYSFPSLKELSNATEQDFKDLGAGYRSSYLVETVKLLQTQDYEINYLKSLDTKTLKAKLLQLKGVGNKVADCILFFGFSRTDVFPVDTWIRKAYKLFCQDNRSDEQISNYFVALFKDCSGYAQQYVFNYMINNKEFYNID